MKHFFSSDLHHRHRSISKYCVRCVDSEDIEAHTEWLIDLHNSIVTDSDNFYHLGDFYFHGKKGWPCVCAGKNER